MKEKRPPTPFSLTNQERSRDLLAVVALGEVAEETPVYTSSVRTFNDGKRFDTLHVAVVRAARHHHSHDMRPFMEHMLARGIELEQEGAV